MRVTVRQEPLQSTARRWWLPGSLMMESRISPLRFARWFALSGRIGDCAGGAAGNPHHGAHGRTTESHGADAGRSGDAAATTIFEARRVERHQQTNTEIAHPKVAEEPGVVRTEKGGDVFDSQNYCIFSDDFGAKAQWNRHTFVNDGHSDLSFKADTGVARFEGHARGKHRFQQARTNGAMDPDGEPDDFSVRARCSSMKNSVMLCGPPSLCGENFRRVNRLGHRHPGDAGCGAPHLTDRQTRMPCGRFKGFARSLLDQMR